MTANTRYRYERIWDDLSELICCCHVDGTLTYVNQAYVECLGQSAEELVGRSVLTGLPEADRVAIQQQFKLLSSQGGSIAVDHAVIVADGSASWYHWRYHAIGDEQGHCLEIQGIGRRMLYSTPPSNSDSANVDPVSLNQSWLQQQVERYRLAVQIGQVGIWDWNLTTDEFYIDAHLKAMLGYADDEIPNDLEAWCRYVYAEDLPIIRQEITKHLEGRSKSYLIEHRMIHRDGTLRWFLARGCALRDGTGTAYRLMGIDIDITPYKHIDLASQQQEQRFRALIENTTDIIVVLDRQGMFTYVSPSAERILGYSDVELVGTVVYGLIHPEDQRLGLKVLRAARRDPGHRQPAWECRIRDRQGQWHSIEAVLTNLLEDPSVAGIVVNCWDVSDRNQTTQALHQLNSDLEDQVQHRTAQLQQTLGFEALLRGITEQVRDSLDEEQILNAAVRELAIGLALECCDTAIYNVHHGTSTICYEYIQADLAVGVGRVTEFSSNPDLFAQVLQGISTQCCFLPPSRSLVRQETYACTILICPLQDNQDVLGDMWLFRPHAMCFSEAEVRLVEQVATQCAIAVRQSRLYQASLLQVSELERLSQLKDDFLSTVSHELRTPMANIKMATQMLEVAINSRQLPLGHQQTMMRYLKILKDECRRETSLINDLLNLAQLESGIQPTNPVSIDMNTTLRKTIALYTERIHNQEQQLVIDLAPTLPVLKTDLSYLERMLNELLSNAHKYTPVGETIRIQSRYLPPDHQARDRQGESNDDRGPVSQPIVPRPAVIQISMINTGVVIPHHELPHMFEKFYRIPNNDPWKYGGTGLGLALVKRLADHLGGLIQVESQAATFTVTLFFFV